MVHIVTHYDTNKKVLAFCKLRLAIEKNAPPEKKIIIGPLIQNYMLNHLTKFQDVFSTIKFSTIFSVKEFTVSTCSTGNKNVFISQT